MVRPFMAAVALLALAQGAEGAREQGLAQDDPAPVLAADALALELVAGWDWDWAGVRGGAGGNPPKNPQRTHFPRADVNSGFS